jgi:aminoglycoside 6'-N-acetyltransferase
VLALRSMTLDDLAVVEEWLADPVVARWWLEGSSVGAEVDDLRQSIVGEQPTYAVVVLADHVPIGWCQWYLVAGYPDFAADVRAEPGDVGIDYAIGAAAYRGRGLGADLIGALVNTVRAKHPRAGVIADPNAENRASRRALERNDFALQFVAPLASETTDAPMAVYRLAP